MTQELGEKLQALRHLGEKLSAIGQKEIASGAPWFMGKPDRWYEDPHWRCVSDHVSTMYIKSEGLGADVCPACFEQVLLTFPEDHDGPLREA